MDIYPILASKPHSPHHLKRYTTFIRRCQLKNTCNDLTENHHICPKATDMFPQYKSFVQFPWNCAALTPRQHYIAHIILWKAYPNINSVTFAAHSMRNYQEKQMTSTLYERLKTAFRRSQSERSTEMHRNMPAIQKERRSKKISDARTGLVAAKTQDGVDVIVSRRVFLDGELVGRTKGMTAVKDRHGNFHHVPVNDPRIQSGEFVGPNAGRVFSEEVRLKLSVAKKGRKKSEETKQRMRKPKGPQQVVTCPHCNKSGGRTNMNRHHFDLCKRRFDSQSF